MLLMLLIGIKNTMPFLLHIKVTTGRELTTSGEQDEKDGSEKKAENKAGTEKENEFASFHSAQILWQIADPQKLHVCNYRINYKSIYHLRLNTPPPDCNLVS